MSLEGTVSFNHLSGSVKGVICLAPLPWDCMQWHEHSYSCVTRLYHEPCDMQRASSSSWSHRIYEHLSYHLLKNYYR